jgi:hypothetical protein
MLARGADPNAQSATDDRTPLDYAIVKGRDIQRCNKEGITLLLEYGSRPGLARNYGETAMRLKRDTDVGCGDSDETNRRECLARVNVMDITWNIWRRR